MAAVLSMIPQNAKSVKAKSGICSDDEESEMTDRNPIGNEPKMML